ncbi:lamin tail domain-containing protein [uncultured Parabacteroides sp.]|uniref:lamin tail domain-containing protein n=1 Tax=uncultured Parabacteroides sp. TaxID=512312 RepID=UPI00259BDEA2|nr:lamin tail domain-containing protein [uncultured Parabacteroides sp.]
MKQFILFLLVLLPVCAFAQFTETFDGPEITTTNQWKGDLNDFQITDDGWLSLIGGPAKKCSRLKISLPYSNNMEWKFDVRMNFTPSDPNHIRFYLLTENLPLLGISSEYYIQIGSTKKTITLRRFRETEKTPVRIIEKELDVLKQNIVSLSVKVTLENSSLWSLYVRVEGENAYTLLGTKEQKISSGIKYIESGFACHYSKKVRGHFIDNIEISSNITPSEEEPENPDPEDPVSPIVLPKLLSVQPLSLCELQFTFDLPVNITNGRFAISGIGKADKVMYADEELKTIVNTSYPKEMVPGTDYTVSYSGLADLEGNELEIFSEDFTLEDDGGNEEGDGDNGKDDEKGTADPGSILINEIMADPKGLKELPETEYVELHNATVDRITLSGWQFSYGGKAKPIETFELPAGGYAVLYRSGRDIKVDPSALEVPLENFPSALANAGKQLQLLDGSGNVIDDVTYDKAKPAKSWERSSSGDWHLSSDPRGGTPGSVNSSGKEEEPTEPEEPVEPDDPDKPDHSEDPDDPDKPDDSEDDPSVIVEPSEFIINELLPNPFAGGSEYIELYNRSDRSLPLSGLSVAVRKADGTLNTRYPLSSVTSMIEPDGYVLLTKNKSGVTDFYTILSSLSLFEIPKLPILANTSSTLVLFRTKDETVIDEVSYSSKWHASSIKDQKGVALERIDPEAETQSAANWTSASATAGYGTPGYQNSQSKIPNPDEPDQPTGVEAPEWVPGSNHYSITYYLDQPGYNCRAFVFNTAGQRVAEIANHELLGLSGQLTWDGSSSAGRKLPTGVYIFYAEVYHSGGTVKRYKQVFLIR